PATAVRRQRGGCAQCRRAEAAGGPARGAGRGAGRGAARMTATRPVRLRPAAVVPAGEAMPPVPGPIRPFVVGALLLCALAGSSGMAVAMGPADITVGDVGTSVLARWGGPDPGLSAIEEGIIWSLRLPRVLAAAAVGAGLALCGAVMQAT